MLKRSNPLARQLHENLSVVLCFVYSRQPLWDIGNAVRGEWKYGWKMIQEYAELRADRALWDFAIQLRALDDEEDLDAQLQEYGFPPFGEVRKTGSPSEPLYLRDMTNKIIHAVGFSYKIEDRNEPLIGCHAREGSRWDVGVIEVQKLMHFGSTLGS